MKKIFWSYLVLLVLIVALPLNGKGQSLNDIYVLSLRLDHLLHGILFFPWPLLYGLSWGFRHQVLALATGLLAAVLLESLQYLLPYRAFNLNDMLGNGVGVVAGSLAMILFRRRFKGKVFSLRAS